MTKKANYIETHPLEFEQGQRARLASVSRDEAPYADGEDQHGKPMKSEALAAWLAGYDAAEGAAARDETSSADSAPKAGDQLHEVAGANKAKAK